MNHHKTYLETMDNIASWHRCGFITGQERIDRTKAAKKEYKESDND